MVIGAVATSGKAKCPNFPQRVSVSSPHARRLAHLMAFYVCLLLKPAHKAIRGSLSKVKTGNANAQKYLPKVGGKTNGKTDNKMMPKNRLKSSISTPAPLIRVWSSAHHLGPSCGIPRNITEVAVF